MTPIGLYNN